MHVQINPTKTCVFTTCKALADLWEASGAPCGYGVARTLTLLGTELAVCGSCSFTSSSTEDKYKKVCKRLKRAALLPTSKYRRCNIVGSACLAVLNYCPVRPLPTLAAEKRIRTLVAQAWAGSSKHVSDAHEIKLALFMPVHRCDWKSSMIVSLLGLIRVALAFSPVSVWQTWLKFHDVRLRGSSGIYGPVTAFLALCRSMDIRCSEHGCIQVGNYDVAVLNADFDSNAWKHDVRQLLRGALLHKLVLRRESFEGVAVGVHREATLRTYNKAHAVEAISLERFFCGSLSPIGKHGDLRPVGNDACPFCESDVFDMQHLIYCCPRFGAQRTLTWTQVEHLAPCFRNHGLVPDMGPDTKLWYPDELTEGLHRQVVSIWTEKLFLETVMKQDGSHYPRAHRAPVHLEQICEKEYNWNTPWHANGHYIVNVGTRVSPKFQCQNCYRIRGLSDKASYSHFPCTPLQRAAKSSGAAASEGVPIVIGQHVLKADVEANAAVCERCGKFRKWSQRGQLAKVACNPAMGSDVDANYAPEVRDPCARENL
eukprot:2139282-Amphidinium_carterae.1